MQLRHETNEIEIFFGVCLGERERKEKEKKNKNSQEKRKRVITKIKPMGIG
jgi:hypothetical protein